MTPQQPRRVQQIVVRRPMQVPRSKIHQYFFRFLRGHPEFPCRPDVELRQDLGARRALIGFHQSRQQLHGFFMLLAGAAVVRIDRASPMTWVID